MAETVVTDIPPSFKPFFEKLFSSSISAAEASAASTRGTAPLPGQPTSGATRSTFDPISGINFGGATATLPAGINPSDLGGNITDTFGPSFESLGLSPEQIASLQQFLLQPGVPIGEPISTGIEPSSSSGQEIFRQITVNSALNDPLVASPFGGGFVAQGNFLERLGLAQRAGLGQEFQGLGRDVLALGQAQARGDFLDPFAPFIQNQIGAAIDPVRREFEQRYNEITGNAVSQGAFKGSSRRDLLEDTLSQGFLNQIGGISANIISQNIARERALQQEAGARIDEGARLAQLPPELLLQSGAGFRQLEQLALEDQLKRFEEGITAPFRSLFPFASILQGTDIGRVQTSSLDVGGLGGGIQGALGGAALGASAGNLIGGGGITGTAVGGGLGALLGALGGAL